jgi:hypothetical protein
LEEYGIARNEAKNIYCKKNKLVQENILQDLQDKFRRNEIRQYYESIHIIKHGFKDEHVPRQVGKSSRW